MSQLALLSPSELDDDRYRISGTRSVQFMLTGFIKERDQFTVFFGGNVNDMYLTTLLEIDAEDERLIFDISGSSDINRRLQNADRLVFAGKPGGIRVQFQTPAPSLVAYQNDKAFSVALPKALMRVQRREYFRVHTPRGRPLMFNFKLPDGTPTALPIYDLSVAGIGLNAEQVPPGLDAPGLKLGRGKFSLPEDPREFDVEIVLRRIAEIENRSGSKIFRIGLQFVGLSFGEEGRVQRYIDRLERERRELM